MSTTITELEAVALGCVATLGPVTAYGVRQEFLKSPSARYSGSAGAIYPLLKRLEARGLVVSRATATGKRAASEYSVTRSGRTALRSWLRSSLEPAAIAVDDPLRTRMLFLDQLTPAQRLEWFDAAERAIGEQEQLIADYAAAGPGTLSVELANDNARRLNRARLRWLREARERWAD